MATANPSVIRSSLIFILNNYMYMIVCVISDTKKGSNVDLDEKSNLRVYIHTLNNSTEKTLKFLYLFNMQIEIYHFLCGH